MVAATPSEGILTDQTPGERDQGWQVGKGSMTTSNKEWMKELRRCNLGEMSLRHLKDCSVGDGANTFLHPQEIDLGQGV